MKMCALHCGHETCSVFELRVSFQVGVGSGVEWGGSGRVVGPWGVVPGEWGRVVGLRG